jgi:hypothetical protein
LVFFLTFLTLCLCAVSTVVTSTGVKRNMKQIERGNVMDTRREP